MTTAIARTDLHWGPIWDELHQAECLWARQLPNEGHNVEETIESMLRASVPRESMARLRELWASLKLDRPFSEDHPDLDWTLQDTLDGPDHTAPGDPSFFLKELWKSQEGVHIPPTFLPDQLEAAADFLRELKYTALCTVWKFTCSWSCYTETLPAQFVTKLREHVFGITMLLLLYEMQ